MVHKDTTKKNKSKLFLQLIRILNKKGERKELSLVLFDFDFNNPNL
jgi:hypothetical protein